MRGSVRGREAQQLSILQYPPQLTQTVYDAPPLSFRLQEGRMGWGLGLDKLRRSLSVERQRPSASEGSRAAQRRSLSATQHVTQAHDSAVPVSSGPSQAAARAPAVDAASNSASGSGSGTLTPLEVPEGWPVRLALRLNAEQRARLQGLIAHARLAPMGSKLFPGTKASGDEGMRGDGCRKRGGDRHGGGEGSGAAGDGASSASGSTWLTKFEAHLREKNRLVSGERNGEGKAGEGKAKIDKDDDMERENGEECLICLTWHTSLNRAKCCGKEVCTVCFVENAYIRDQAQRASACPFCKSEGFGVVYRPPIPPTTDATEEEGGAEKKTSLVAALHAGKTHPSADSQSSAAIPPVGRQPSASPPSLRPSLGTPPASSSGAARAAMWRIGTFKSNPIFNPRAPSSAPGDLRGKSPRAAAVVKAAIAAAAAATARADGDAEREVEEEVDDLNCETESESEYNDNSVFDELESGSISSWSDSEYSDRPSSPGSFPKNPSPFGGGSVGSAGSSSGGGGGNDVGDGDTKGVTPLHVATHFGRLDAMTLLMNRGAQPSVQAANAITPLHIAAKVGNSEAARLLISRGADPDARTTDRAYTPLHLAVKFGHVEVVKALCDGHGGSGAGTRASASAAGLGGITPLHIACRRGRARCAAALLGFGADIEAGTSPAATDGGIRPLHIAARFGHQSLVRLLVDRGAKIDCATQRQLLTPLLIAAACGQTSIVALLLRRGALLKPPKGARKKGKAEEGDDRFASGAGVEDGGGDSWSHGRGGVGREEHRNAVDGGGLAGGRRGSAAGHQVRGEGGNTSLKDRRTARERALQRGHTATATFLERVEGTG